MGEYFSSNLSPWRVPMVTISNINIKRGWKYVEPTLAVNMWRGCLICMGYIYFDHRISRDPSLKRICIFVKKYTFLLGKKYEKVENIWNHIGQQRRNHVHNSFLPFLTIPFQDSEKKSTIAPYLWHASTKLCFQSLFSRYWNIDDNVQGVPEKTLL